MICFVSLFLSLIAIDKWMASAHPVTMLDIVQLEKHPEFDNLERLKEVTANTNCTYERVEASTTFNFTDVEEWYPKMRPVAKCRSNVQNCEEVGMTLLFLMKPYNATTYQTYWVEWNVTCTTELPAREAEVIEFQRSE